MITLGVDLSTNPKRTACCFIKWEGDVVTVCAPSRPRSLEHVISDVKAADVSALDAPFGWPVDFLEWVSHFSQGHAPPPISSTQFRLRETDRFVHAARRAIAKESGWRQPRSPLSVSSDKIAATAFMAGNVLSAASPDGQIDRLGAMGIYEAYPAATIELFGFPTAGYKAEGDVGIQARQDLLTQAEDASGGWLELDESVRTALCSTDHCLDAFFCSLTARAAALGLVLVPTTETERNRASVEGWIQVPDEPDSLGRLVSHARPR